MKKPQFAWKSALRGSLARAFLIYYIRRQLKQYSVDFSVTKDRDTGQMYLWFKGQDVDRIQTALENCIAERGKERPIPELRDLCDRAAQRVKEMNQSRPVPPPEHGERL